MSKREYKLSTPGTEPAREVESVVVPVELPDPDALIDTTPEGLPRPEDVDATTIRRPVLTTEGWVCPDIRPGGA